MNFYFGCVGFDPDRATIRRDHDDEGPSLFDFDNQRAWTFPKGWTDDQIKAALQFAEASYLAGVTEGEQRKTQEIEQALAQRA